MDKHTLTLKIQTLYKNPLNLHRFDDEKKKWRRVNNETVPSLERDQIKIVSYNI